MGLSAEDASGLLPNYTKHLDDAAVAETEAGRAALDELEPGIRAVAVQMGLSAEEAEAYAKHIEQVAQQLDAFSEPLSVYQQALRDKQAAERESFEATLEGTEGAAEALRNFEASAALSLDEVAAAWEKSNEDSRNWQTNLVKVAEVAGADVAQILREMGPEAAGLVADMADGRGAAHGERSPRGGSARLGSQGAAQEMELGMRVMEEKGRLGARPKAIRLHLPSALSMPDLHCLSLGRPRGETLLLPGAPPLGAGRS